MPFCPKCGAGAADDALFCTRCGASIGPAAGNTTAGTSRPAAAAGIAPNAAAMLSYLLGFVSGVFFLVVEPYRNDPFVRFHCFQSIFFSIAWIVVSMVWSILFVPIGIVTVGYTWLIFGFIGRLIFIAFLLFWLFLMYKAYNNEKFMIPFLGDLAARQAG